VLQANDENDEAEHVDAPLELQPQPQPWGPPTMNPLDPLQPQIMNAIQQGMQANMASFHSSYNEQYHQPVKQYFDALYTNLGIVRDDVDTLTNQFGSLSTNVQNIQQQLTCFTDHINNVFPPGPLPPGYMSYP
jgi:hypothetical protein